MFGALLGPIIGAIARAGSAIFVRQGAKSVAAAAARGGATSVRGGIAGAAKGGQNVLEGAGITNAKKLTEALDALKGSGMAARKATGAAGRDAIPVMGGGGGKPPPLAGDFKGLFDDYVKKLQHGSIASRYKRLSESGQMLPTSTVQSRAKTLHPSHKQMVQHTERALIRAKRRELRRQERDTTAQSLNNNRLAKATSLLISGAGGFYALGKSMEFFSQRVQDSSRDLSRYSMLIAGEQRLTELARMIADIRTARMTERTYGRLSASGRQAIEAWQRPKATAKNVMNTLGTLVNTISAGIGGALTSILEGMDRINEILTGIKEDQRDGELPQQAFRDYWNAMSGGKWGTDLGDDRPKRPESGPMARPVDPRNPLGGFLGQ